MKKTKNRRTGLHYCPPLAALLIPLCTTIGGTPPSALAEQSAPETSALLTEVVVTATRTPHTIKDVPVETVVITRQDMEQSNAQNAMDALKTVPGITSAVHDDVFGTYTWRAKMRGLNFNDGYGLILIDGQRVMGSGQSGGMGEYGIGLNQIPVEMIERIEVVKGPSSALYGSDAMAGVINVITSSTPEKASARAGASYGWYTIKDKVNSDGTVSKPSDDGQSRNVSQAFLSVGDRPLERLAYLIHYNYESADDIRQDPIASDRHSLMAKVDLAATDTLDFFLKGEASTYEKTDNREEDSYRLSAGLEWQPSPDHFLAVKGYTYSWDFVHGYPGYSYGFKHGDTGFDQMEIQYTWYASDEQTWTLGGESQRQGIDYIIDNADGSTIGVEENVTTNSLYAQDEITLFDDVTLVAGARFDDHSNFGSEVNPKLSLMYALTDATTLRASAGRSFKSPTIRQLYYDSPYRHGSYYVQSNRELQPEIGMGYSAGVEQWLYNDHLLASVSMFRNEIDDMVIREDTNTLYDGLPLLTYRNVEQATTQGVEFLTKFSQQDFSLTLAYTYTASEDNATGKDLTYVPEHSLTLLPAYEWPAYGLGLSGVLTYTGKQYTDSANTSEIGANTVVDARIYKKLTEGVRLSFEVDNLFDSDKGDEGNYRSGRMVQLKMDVSF